MRRRMVMYLLEWGRKIVKITRWLPRLKILSGWPTAAVPMGLSPEPVWAISDGAARGQDRAARARQLAVFFPCRGRANGGDASSGSTSKQSRWRWVVCVVATGDAATANLPCPHARSALGSSSSSSCQAQAACPLPAGVT